MADGDVTVLGGIAFDLKLLTAGVEAGVKKFTQSTDVIRKDYDKLLVDNTKLNSSFEQMSTESQQQIKALKEEIQAMKAQSEDTATGVEASHLAIAASAALMAVKVKQALDAGIQAYAEYEQALTGIQNIAASKGIGDQALTASMDKVIDEFFTLKDASETYSNFLIMGFSTEQIEKMIIAMKESASVARKSGHTIGSALATSAQGFRQEISTLSDAAGITTNISKMYEIYAKSIGKTVSALSEAEKNQAIYNAIMSESEPYVGSYANTLDSMSGSLNSVTQSKEQFNIAFGEANAETMKLFNQVQSEVLGVLTGLIDAFPGATTGVTTFLLSFAAIQAVTKATAVLSKFSDTASGLGLFLGKLNPILMGVSLAASVGAMMYTNVKKEQEEARKAQEEYIKGLETEIKSRSENISTLDALGKRYEELTRKENTSYKEKRELRDISEKLSEQYGINIDDLDKLGGAYGNTAEAIRDKVKAMKEENLENAKQIHDKTYSSLKDEEGQYEKNIDIIAKYNKKKQELEDIHAEVKKKQDSGIYDDEAQRQNSRIQGLMDELEFLKPQYDKALSSTDAYVSNSNQEMISKLRIQAAEMSIAGSEGASLFLDAYISMLEDALEKSEGAVSLIDFSQIILGDADNVSNLNALSNYKDQVLKGIEPTSDDIAKYEEAWAGIYEALESAFGEDRASAILMNFAPWLEKIPASAEAAAEGFGSSVKDMEAEANAVELDKNFTKATESIDKVSKSIDTATSKATKMKALNEAFKLYKEGDKSVASLDKLNKALEESGYGLVATADNADALGKTLEEMGSKSVSELEDMKAELLDARSVIEEMAAQEISAHGEVTVETQGALDDIDSLIGKILFFLQLAGLADMKPKGGGGGGGSSKYQKDIQEMEQLKKLGQLNAEQELAYLEKITSAKKKADKEDYAVRMYEARERVRTEAIQKEYDYIAYLSDLNKIELADKVKMYEDIGRNHKLNVEERKKLEVELYQLQEELRQQQIDDDYASIAHQRAIGQMTLAEEIKLTEAIRQNHELTAKEIWDLEESLYSLYEQKRQEEIGEYRAFHSYLVGLDRMTTEEQIASLEKLLATHQLTQQEIRDLEVEIYQLRKQLEEDLNQAKEDTRNKEVEQLDSVTNALIKALENRYKAMKDAELAELDESKEKWREWADSNIKGIEEQIKALDKLKTSRDDEKAEAEQLKKIAKLKEEIAFADSDYNRMQLEKQLQQAQSSLEDWLLDKDTRDKKEALQEEINAIREEAKAKQEAIEAEKKALQELYDQQRENAKYEAIELISQGDLDRVLDLLGQYNKDFNLAGLSLGEQLYDGFSKVVEDIEAYMNSIMDKYKLIQQEAHRTAMAAAESFYSQRQQMMNEAVRENVTTIQTTNQFYVQPNDYYQIQRDIEKANRELARQLGK